MDVQAKKEKENHKILERNPFYASIKGLLNTLYLNVLDMYAHKPGEVG